MSEVVVNFWASWCPPCRDEAPALKRVWREYEDKGVVFVGVNFNDVTIKAMAFIEEFDITYPNGPDPYNRISGAYHITGVPETFLIAKDGRFVGWYRGLTEARLRAALQKAYEQHRDQGFVILAVDIGESLGTVQAYTQELGLTFPTLLDKKSTVAQRYRVPGVPTSFFINRQGVIHVQRTGPLDESLIKKYLDEIM